MTDVLERLAPFEVRPSGLLVPEQLAITYPGNDAWLELEASVVDPGADPAWAMVEKVPDSGSIPNKVVTAQGANPPSTSTSTSVFGGASLLCPNLAGVALQTPNHADWNFGSGDFTVEGRYYITVARKAIWALRTGSGADHGWEVTMDAGSSSDQRLTFYWCVAGADGTTFTNQIDWPFTATLNVWYHIVVLRIGNILRGFVNGAQVGTDTAISGAIRDSGSILTIFGDNRSSGNNDFRGYADELRISKGIARWTGTSFTPPAAAYTRDNYTKLLMHFDGPDGGTAYTDSSGQAGAPFDPGSDPAWMEVER